MKNTLLMVFFAFIMLYTIPAKIFFFDGILFSAHNQRFTYETAAKTTLIFAFFLLLLNVFVKISPPLKTNILKFRNNDLIFIFLLLASFFFTLTAVKGESLLSGAAYGSVEKQTSSLNEYILIIFLIAYIFSGGKKYNLYALYGVIYFYAAKNMLLGGRIEVVMLLLMFFAIKFQYKISFSKTIVFFIIGVWFMSMFSNIRSNPTSLIQGDILAIVNPFGESKSQLSYQVSNEGDVYWASERLLVMMKQGELPLEDRARAGFNYFLSVFIPTDILGPTGNLAVYKKEKFSTGGGGLAPLFFYSFLGFIGVSVFAYFIAMVITGINKNGSSLEYIYIVLLVTTVPRWFAYYPIHCVKFCIWGVLIYWIILSVDYTMKKYRHKE